MKNNEMMISSLKGKIKLLYNQVNRNLLTSDEFFIKSKSMVKGLRIAFTYQSESEMTGTPHSDLKDIEDTIDNLVAGSIEQQRESKNKIRFF